jgi:hypothetical protein
VMMSIGTNGDLSWQIIVKVLSGPTTEDNVLSNRYLCTVIKEKAYVIVYIPKI